MVYCLTGGGLRCAGLCRRVCWLLGGRLAGDFLEDQLSGSRATAFTTFRATSIGMHFWFTCAGSFRMRVNQI
jgi:hypothetical protein